MSTSTATPDTRRVIRAMLLIAAGLLVLLGLFTVILLVTLAPDSPAEDPADTGHTPGVSEPVDDGVTLPLTPDAGLAYQDRLTFVGDSLTAHLASRGVLSGGQATTQVWKTENNMLNLNSEVTSAKIIIPGTGELMTIADAAAELEPEILIITLGTDWGVSYLTEADFKACYSDLVQAVQKASPKTTVILQSIFPVTAGCVNLDNAKIDTANTWVKAIAAENGCHYLDTQSILKDDKNNLKDEYCNSSDGIHMGANAYVAILEYIRTHAVE